MDLVDIAQTGDLAALRAAHIVHSLDLNMLHRGDTLLHVAATAGHHKLISWLIDNGADANARNDDGNTPLHCAAANGHTAAVHRLIARGAAIDRPGYSRLRATPSALRIKGMRFNGCTALHVACFFGHLEIVQTLLRSNANMMAEDVDNWTPLHWAVAGGQLTVVRVLLDSGVDVDARALYGSTPLNLSAADGHLEITGILLDYGATVKPYSVNPLASAAEHGHMHIIDLLTRRELFTTYEDLEIPLYVAVCAGHLSAVRHFLDYTHAMTTEAWYQLLERAVQREHVEVFSYILSRATDLSQNSLLELMFIATSRGQVDMMHELTATRVDINAKINETTTLHRILQLDAFGAKALRGLRWLLENGAAVDALDGDGRGPHHYADAHPSARELLRRYAKPAGK